MSGNPTGQERINVIEIPVTSKPQRFSFWLANQTWVWKLYWLRPMSCWVIDICDFDGTVIIGGIPLVAGTDLLGQFQYTGAMTPGSMVIISDHRWPDETVGYDELGTVGHIYWAPRPG